MFYLIAGSNEQAFTKSICKNLKATVLSREISYFKDGELKVRVKDGNLKGKKVYIIQSIFGNANDKAMELFLLADAMQNLGCSSINAIVPYFGYARQNRAGPGEAMSFQCLIRLIKASGIDKIITVDLHAPGTNDSALPIVNLETTEIFQKVVKNKDNAIIIAPDFGATHRAKALADLIKVQFIVSKKERVGMDRLIKVIDIPDVETIRDKDCYLIDDILDTGNTIFSVAKELEKFKPKSICGLVSHGIFSNGAVQALQKSCIKKVYVTNSIHFRPKCSKISVLGLGPMISDYLNEQRKTHDK